MNFNFNKNDKDLRAFFLKNRGLENLKKSFFLSKCFSEKVFKKLLKNQCIDKRRVKDII